MIRTPPDFCASAIGAASASDNANAAANPPRFRLIAHASPGGRAVLVVGIVWRSSRVGCRRRQVTPQPIAGPSRRAVVSASAASGCHVRTRLRSLSRRSCRSPGRRATPPVTAFLRHTGASRYRCDAARTAADSSKRHCHAWYLAGAVARIVNRQTPLGSALGSCCRSGAGPALAYHIWQPLDGMR